jgi:hypothetical protein
VNKAKHDCKCCLCGESKGDKIAKLADLKEKEKEWLKKPGWFAHMVGDVNYHTHGLDLTQNHINIEVVLPIDPNLIHDLITSAIDLIKKGKKFESGKDYARVIKKLKVRFVKSREGDRDVLRMIIPDKNGNLDKDKMEETFAKQWDGLSE